jgi:hypothetical protein
MLLRKIRSVIDYIVRGELFLFCRAIVANVLPNSAFSAGKFYLYDLQSLTKHSIELTEERFAITPEGRETLPALPRCYESVDPQDAIKVFEGFFQENNSLWCARDLSLADRPVAGVVWLFRGVYVIPLEGYDRYSICFDWGRNDRAFIGTAHVNTHYRRMGLFSRIMEAIAVHDQKLHLFSSVDAENCVSIAAHARIGFRCIGAIHYVRIGSRAWCRIGFPGISRRLWPVRKGNRQIVPISSE